MPPSVGFAVIAAYRFVDVDDPPALQRRLRANAETAALKGTVLLAPEGINLSLAGTAPALRAWLDALVADPRLGGLEVKWHAATRVPLARLRVKCKPEIIRMNQPAVRPATGRAPAVAARTLTRWLQQGHCDEGRPLTMLDTRNAFDVDAGAFADAVAWRLAKFSDFPEALVAHADELRSKTVVSYCTGGIRCEKAALWMAQQGVAHVRQLAGGILRYVEATDGAPHWRGRCVVFDDRGALNTALAHER